MGKTVFKSPIYTFCIYSIKYLANFAEISENKAAVKI
jgi:hypothetical protein